MAINLDEAERHVTAIRNAAAFGIRRAHRNTSTIARHRFVSRKTARPWSSAPIIPQTAVEVMLYDFGAVTVIYRIPLDGPFEGLLGLSETLYENDTLRTESAGD